MAIAPASPHRSADDGESGADEADRSPSPSGPTAAAELVERLRLWVRWIGPGRLLASTGALAIVVALGWWLLRSPAAPTEARLPSAASSTTSPGDPVGSAPGGRTDVTGALVPGPSTSLADLVVHVAGAVNAPGVFELPAGARVGDAVAAAGGASADGDPDALNLAAPLVDGDRVAVPVRGAVPVGAGADGGVTNAAADQRSGPVNVNTASAADLEGLPGVGPATAAAIVAHREANGPFASVDDLESVRGIGPAKLEALRDAVTV
jgi:competence protein ComEA